MHLGRLIIKLLSPSCFANFADSTMQQRRLCKSLRQKDENTKNYTNIFMAAVQSTFPAKKRLL